MWHGHFLNMTFDTPPPPPRPSSSRASPKEWVKAPWAALKTNFPLPGGMRLHLTHDEQLGKGKGLGLARGSLNSSIFDVDLARITPTAGRSCSELLSDRRGPWSRQACHGWRELEVTGSRINYGTCVFDCEYLGTDPEILEVRTLPTPPFWVTP